MVFVLAIIILWWSMSPVTPVMAAIYYGETETAQLLLDAGAVCDFSRPEFRTLLQHGNEETWKTASALPGVGFESLSPQEISDLKNPLPPTTTVPL